MKKLFPFIALILLNCCIQSEKEQVSDYIQFNNQKKVTIINYNYDVMEPFISRDGNILF